MSVVDTTPPVITCASNQVVEFGNAWDFVAPTATDIADGQDLTFAVLEHRHQQHVRQDVRGHPDVVGHGRLRQLQCLFPGRERCGHHAARDHLRLQPGG